MTGAIVTTVESLIFELLENSNHENFKAVSLALKASKEKVNEFENDTTSY
jgi:hypothetical protein